MSQYYYTKRLASIITSDSRNVHYLIKYSVLLLHFKRLASITTFRHQEYIQPRQDHNQVRIIIHVPLLAACKVSDNLCYNDLGR